MDFILFKVHLRMVKKPLVGIPTNFLALCTKFLMNLLRFEQTMKSWQWHKFQTTHCNFAPGVGWKIKTWLRELKYGRKLLKLWNFGKVYQKVENRDKENKGLIQGAKELWPPLIGKKKIFNSFKTTVFKGNCIRT